MGTIDRSDIIYATLTQRGTTLGTYRIEGMSSKADVIRHLRSMVKNCLGIVTLSLRNSTQGWQHRQSLLWQPRQVVPVQLSLF